MYDFNTVLHVQYVYTVAAIMISYIRQTFKTLLLIQIVVRNNTV